jgi:hypothetical protein
MVKHPAPSRQTTGEYLLNLATGHLTRETAARWAEVWVAEVDGAEDVRDPLVWQALLNLAGADLQTSPSEYLHSDADFHDWLAKFDSAILETEKNDRDP